MLDRTIIESLVQYLDHVIKKVDPKKVPPRLSHNKEIESVCPFCFGSKSKTTKRQFYLNVVHKPYMFNCFKCGSKGTLTDLIRKIGTQHGMAFKHTDKIVAVASTNNSSSGINTNNIDIKNFNNNRNGSLYRTWFSLLNSITTKSTPLLCDSCLTYIYYRLGTALLCQDYDSLYMVCNDITTELLTPYHVNVLDRLVHEPGYFICCKDIMDHIIKRHVNSYDYRMLGQLYTSNMIGMVGISSPGLQRIQVRFYPKANEVTKQLSSYRYKTYNIFKLDPETSTSIGCEYLNEYPTFVIKLKNTNTNINSANNIIGKKVLVLLGEGPFTTLGALFKILNCTLKIRKRRNNNMILKKDRDPLSQYTHIISVCSFGKTNLSNAYIRYVYGHVLNKVIMSSVPGHILKEYVDVAILCDVDVTTSWLVPQLSTIAKFAKHVYLLHVPKQQTGSGNGNVIIKDWADSFEPDPITDFVEQWIPWKSPQMDRNWTSKQRYKTT